MLFLETDDLSEDTSVAFFLFYKVLDYFLMDYFTGVVAFRDFKWMDENPPMHHPI